MIELHSIAEFVSTAMHFVTDRTGFNVKEKMAASCTLAGEDCYISENSVITFFYCHMCITDERYGTFFAGLDNPSCG
jgi:hypothetical protein